MSQQKNSGVAGAATGAVIGGIIGGPVGAIIGALVGGAATQDNSKPDRSYQIHWDYEKGCVAGDRGGHCPGRAGCDG